MCGRFSLTATATSIMRRFYLDELTFEWVPRYNIAPGQMIPAIIAREGKRRMGLLKWGLVPSWAQDEKIGTRMINARAETISEKPAFRRLVERKRCVIPADGFYEWKATDRGKRPVRIVMKDGEPFTLAGLYDTWTGPGGERVHTCTIITTAPNELVAEIHNRMPVILRPEDEERWLDVSTYGPDALAGLLAPFESNRMRAYPVPTVVGNPRNDVPACVEEVPWH